MLKLFPAVVPFDSPVRLRLPGRYLARDLEDWFQSPNPSMGFIELHHRSVENINFHTDMINSVVQFSLKNFNEDVVNTILKLGVREDTRFLLVENIFEAIQHPQAMTLNQICAYVKSIQSSN